MLQCWIIGLWVCSLGWAGAAGAQQFVPDADEYRHAPTGIAFPSRLGDFRKGGQVEYEPQAPGLGVQVNYVVGAYRLVADIYVYTGGFKQVADGEDAREVIQVFQQSVGDIYIAQQRGMYSDVRQLYDGVLAFGSGATQLKARVGEFAYQRSGVETHSRLYLFARRNHFIKLRISVPQANAGVAPALIQGLLDDFARLLSQEPLPTSR
jgi:hypothetical protein